MTLLCKKITPLNLPNCLIQKIWLKGKSNGRTFLPILKIATPPVLIFLIPGIIAKFAGERFTKNDLPKYGSCENIYTYSFLVWGNVKYRIGLIKVIFKVGKFIGKCIVASLIGEGVSVGVGKAKETLEEKKKNEEEGSKPADSKDKETKAEDIKKFEKNEDKTEDKK